MILAWASPFNIVNKTLYPTTYLEWEILFSWHITIVKCFQKWVIWLGGTNQSLEMLEGVVEFFNWPNYLFHFLSAKLYFFHIMFQAK